MNPATHLTDEVLTRVLDDEQFDTRVEDIEGHLESCDQCRARLEALAADQDWIAPFRASLSSDFAIADASRLERRRAPADNSANSYDLAAIESMLDELLAPSLHPENMGQLGKYEVEEVIGFGGMGVVLKAYDRELQRPVAIKLVVPRLAHDGTAKQRFAREAKAAATVLHPNVIAIHCIDETQGVPWFVMPLVNGPSLEELVQRNGPLPEPEIVRIGLQIASGLAAAHSHGVTHRDIKPANILVDNYVNRVVITDFGLARQQSDTMITQTGFLAGTLQYMSPEQTRGEELDNRSDLFSLGGLLHFLATGSAPFESETPVGILHKIANKRQPDVRRHNPSISKTLATAIDTLLAKNAGERFQSASELESFFSKLISHQNQPTQHQAPRVPKSRPMAKLKWWMALAPVLVMAAFFLWRYGPNTLAPPSLEPTRAETWATIQSAYEMDAPEIFARELEQLSASVDRLNAEFSVALPAFEDPSLASELGELTSRTQYLQQALDNL